MKHTIEDVETLVEMGINEQQALATLGLFPDLDEAILVVDAYKHPPAGFERYVRTFSDYLETLRNASRGVTEDRNHYEQEVDERIALVSEEVLTQRGYRDRPSRAKDFNEQVASSRLDQVDVDETAIERYVLRKLTHD